MVRLRHDRWDRIVISETDLLALTGHATVEELGAIVDDDSDADMWVSALDDGVEVGAGGSSTVLAYPFALEEFWEVVAEVEQAQIDRWEAGDDGPALPG